MSLPRIMLTLCATMAVLCVPATAQAAPATPSPDSVLNELIQLDPASMAQRLKEMKEQAASLEAESKELQEKAAEIEEKSKAIKARIEPFLAVIKALAEAEGMRPPAPPEEKAAMANPGMAGKQPDAEMAAAKPAVTFAEHVLPLFQQRCFSCHGNGEARGGLSLMTFGNALQGGSSGEVIKPGDPDGSRLFRLVARLEEPFMPQNGQPLTQEELDLIREWISLGAPENAGSKVMVAEKKEMGGEPIFIAAEMSEGPPPMPEVPLDPARDTLDRGMVARAITTSPTAPLAAVAGDQEILLYSLEDFHLLGAIPFPRGDVYSMTFSLNGEILAAAGGEEGFSQAVVLYDVRQAKEVGEYGKGFDTVLAVDISPDHKMVAAGGPDKKVRVYGTADGKLLYELNPHTDWIYSVKFSPDGELLATADRAGGLYLWQAANGRPVENLRGHNAAIHDLAYTIDSNILASAGGQGEIIYWDTWKYSRVRRLDAHGGAVLSLDWNNDGVLVSSGEDGLTKRWGLDGKNLANYGQQPDWVYQARYGRNGSVVLSGIWTGEVVVYNAENGERVANLATNPTPELMVAGTPDEAPAEIEAAP